MNQKFPDLYLVKNELSAPEIKDVSADVNKKIDALHLEKKLQPGQSIALTAGSRGINDNPLILKQLVLRFKKMGLNPFIVPAMGTHGGATKEGQENVLKSLGIEEKSMGAPIVSSVDVVEIGKTKDGVPIFIGKDFVRADHVVVINRIKPHTDFAGRIESGLLKMMTIGMAKHKGAMLNHKSFIHYGFSEMAIEIGRHILTNLPILMGIGIIENQNGKTSYIEVIPPERMIQEEIKLLEKAKKISPSIPFDNVDCLLVDKMGKEISGTGMDTKVIGRIMHIVTPEPPQLKFKRIFVKDLTRESHGNACGIGLADFTSDRLVSKIDKRVTMINCTLGGSPEKGRIPISFGSDKEAIVACFNTSGVYRYSEARLVWIKNTLDMQYFKISDALRKEADKSDGLTVVEGPIPFSFDSKNNLPDVMNRIQK